MYKGLRKKGLTESRTMTVEKEKKIYNPFKLFLWLVFKGRQGLMLQGDKKTAKKGLKFFVKFMKKHLKKEEWLKAKKIIAKRLNDKRLVNYINYLSAKI